MQTGMDLKKITSKHVQYLHKKMCDCYGETAKSISLTCFMSNMMIFCIDLAATPSHMKSADEDRPLQLVSSGSVDDAAPFSRGIQGIVFHRKSTQTNYVECSDQVRANQFLTGRAVGEVMEQYSQILGQRGLTKAAPNAQLFD